MIIPATARNGCNPKMKTRNNNKRPQNSLAGAGRALRRAALVARKTARIYGTPVYIWRAGKIVAEKP